MNTNTIVVVLLVVIVAIGGVMLKNQTDDKNDRVAAQEYEKKLEHQRKIDEAVKTLERAVGR